ncbi:MAG: hypothetical protein ACRC4J_00820 [Cetobacterium sp.]
MIPVIPSVQKIDPVVQERAFLLLRNSHALEHQAIAALKAGDITTTKMTLQRQIQVLVSVLAAL